MARLLPAGLVDPSVAEDASEVRFDGDWAFHFDVNCCGSPGYAHFAVAAGRPVVLSGLDSVVQWVRAALSIARGRYRAYSPNFGSDFEQVLGERRPEASTEAERMVIEALAVDPRIDHVSAEASLSPQYGMTVKVLVQTVDGSSFALDDFRLED